MSTQKDIASPWDGARFARERNTGVILGLALNQVIALGTGIGLIVAVMVFGTFPRNLLLAVVLTVLTAGIGLPRFAGKSLIEWIGLMFKHVLRSLSNQLKYVHRDNAELYEGEEPAAQTLGEDSFEGEERNEKGRIRAGKGLRFRLPGEAQELRGQRLPGGAGFIYDARTGEGLVVAQIITSKGFNLESFELQEDRTAGWRDGLTAVAQMPGVVRVQASDQTTLISGKRVREFYDEKRHEAARDAGGVERVSGEGIDPFLHTSFMDLMTEAQDMPVHEMWLTIVLSKQALSRRIRALGGGLPGFMEVALGVMGTVEAILPVSGTEVVGWHSLRSIAALSRSAFDPDSSVQISERTGAWAGVAPSSAGPMAMNAPLDRVTTDGFLHRTYKVSEFPQSQARLGFLDAFVFAGDFRHTVTSYYLPRDAKKARKMVQRRKADWHTTNKLLRNLDRQPSLEHEREIEDIELEEAELVAGNAPIDFVVLITVTGRDELDLEANCADMLSKAVQANCELRPVFAEQDAGFLASALPFGRVDM